MLRKIITLLCLIVFVGISSLGTGWQPLHGQGSVDEQRAKLEAELAKLEEEITEQQTKLDGQKKETGSIKRDISILETKIKQTQSKIRQKSLKIEQLSSAIVTKKEVISDLEDLERRQKETLAKLIQTARELDDMTLAELLLSGQNVSAFFISFDEFVAVNRSLQESFAEIADTKNQTLAEKKGLEVQKTEEELLKNSLNSDKRQVETNKSQKNKLLSASRSKEQNYESILKDRKKKAAEIRAALFSLRDSSAIPFGEALEYAKIAGEATGVRPAFILGVLKQESNLGQNVGSCYLTNDPGKGDGRTIKSGTAKSKVMKPTRDVDPFMEITSELGIDPFTTPVSCPWKIGYGGAMGPSQFIPSTWQIFKKRIAATVGVRVANPWNPQHAITATAIYMKDLGAHRQTYDAEINSACKYYSGVSCSHPTVQNLFYGKAVLKHAEEIQKNIDILDEF